MSDKIYKTNEHIHSCSKCLYREFCIAGGKLSESDIAALETIIDRKKTLRKGETLYKAQDPLVKIFAIRSGSVKIYSLNSSGDEQITSFHIAGDILGFDAIAENVHQSFSEALESTSLCEIDYQGLVKQFARHPNLAVRFLKLISQEISSKKNLTMMISRMTASQRLAAFLLHFAYNLHVRKLSSTELKLTMTRYEIGNYIALSVETISRLLAKLKEMNIIAVHGRYITILDKEGLEKCLQAPFLI